MAQVAAVMPILTRTENSYISFIITTPIKVTAAEEAGSFNFRLIASQAEVQ